MQRANYYCNVLKQNGLKSTKRRTAILEILGQSDQPISIEQVYLVLKGKGVSINLSTVYRVLEALTARNLATKLSIAEDGRALYELNLKTHKHHLICKNCKKMFSVEGCPLKDYDKQLKDKTGFEVTGHKLEIYGYCRNCKALKDLV